MSTSVNTSALVHGELVHSSVTTEPGGGLHITFTYRRMVWTWDYQPGSVRITTTRGQRTHALIGTWVGEPKAGGAGLRWNLGGVEYCKNAYAHEAVLWATNLLKDDPEALDLPPFRIR